VSGGFTPDRFLMGLLSATADAVIVGAGTVRSGHHHQWTPGHVHPASAPAYAGLARSSAAAPATDDGHRQRQRADRSSTRACGRPTCRSCCWPDAGAAWLRRIELPPAVEVVVAGDHERVEEDAILAALAARDLDLVVCRQARLLGGLSWVPASSTSCS
jgi:hypothetical protein